MRYSVIGTGWITRAFIDAVRLTGKAELYAERVRKREEAKSHAQRGI